jgi:uncharacterized membrane protein
MNLHPIFVHFPIALFTVYAALELARFRPFTDRAYLFYVKATLLLFGIVGAAIAVMTGNAIASTYASDPVMNHLVQTHRTWALITIGIFGVLSLCYLFAWLAKEKPQLANRHAAMKKTYALANQLIDSSVVPVLALLGLIAVTFAGALGGAIVYGTNVDPVVTFVTKLLL